MSEMTKQDVLGMAEESNVKFVRLQFTDILDGIKNEIEPPEEILTNIYDMTADEKEELGVDSLPGDINEAVEALLADDIIQGALGSHVLKQFVAAKESEWDDYKAQVHQWELDRYLENH
jgi:glutamine synthetase